MEINRKTYGGLFIVLAYLILIRVDFDQWDGIFTAFFSCIIGALIMKEKNQRWYENRWFKGYVSVQVIILLLKFYGFLIDIKLDWFIPEDVLYDRLYQSRHTELLSLFLFFFTWFVFTCCYFSDKKQWFKRWHLSIWTLLIFIGWNIAMLNHYQYIDKTSIHNNGMFSSNTLSFEEVWMMEIEPKTETIYGRYGRKTESFRYDINLISREGHSITLVDMLLTEKDIHAAIMIMNGMKDSGRETRISRLNLMSVDMRLILNKNLDRLDDELADLFRDNFLENRSSL
ncbi:hypothetical protein [Bacillus alkalicellulosilyticus]|uniref:hypothetical protein n=1 Tax=Alkalihalobacterium alkalicellulosilyticum TaxID=1912214 RepID=UPI0009969C42|nr:hypothetical protein [Bacillus alkalicellulosilyticus]